MIVEVSIPIKGSRAATWAAITDIENAAQIISGIKKIEVVEKPASGLVGLKWRETRVLFGEPASAVKWITDATEAAAYTTRAEDKGFVFLTSLRITENGEGLTLTSSHESVPQTFAARLQLIPMALLFKGAIRKAVLQDLNDIKSAVERG